MLAEARARVVDVETGVAPRAMRPLEADSPAQPPAPPQTPKANGGGAKRPQSERASAPRPAGRHQRETATVEAHGPMPEPASVDQEGSVRPSTAGSDPSAAAFGTDELLSLEDTSDAAGEPGNGSTASAPWRRGLRG
jgi:hypothetical protein